ncbi:major facilitator superfamily domain-containing protein [Lipomyces japonicus]|uniref:major facilitator superfamily domain-containing protein n=1 Tax=Lipomyces japonicus TaxID=56871 RepID=UPI0034D01BE5
MQSYIQYRRAHRSAEIEVHDKEKFSHAVEKALGDDSERTQETKLILSAVDSSISKQSENEQPEFTKISQQSRQTHEDVILVGWNSSEDSLNPRNFSKVKKVTTTLIVALIAFVVGAASSMDVAVLPQAASDLGVSDVVESLATGVYLMGYAVGAVLAAPFSEVFGRNLVYISTMFLFCLFIMASALAPNIGSQIVLRFLAGLFGSTPLVCAGGSVADIWDSKEKTYGFPMYAISSFGGPVLGPVIGSYIGDGYLNSWRWSEWVTLFLSALAMLIVFFFMPETFGPLILKWKASGLRKLTGSKRYRSEMELMHKDIWIRIKLSLLRPLQMSTEPIIILMALYLTVLYIVLFTFLNGYTFIYKDVYGISQGLSNVIFIGIYIGILLASFLVYPLYKYTERKMNEAIASGKTHLPPEIRLWYAMLGGSISVPVSLFWMGWTDYSSISIWSPILASVLFGYGVICIFMTVYMYVIDCYEVYAGSALTLVTFMRYMTAGGMTVVGIPFYRNLGTHWTLTIMGCISSLLVPLPYVFYKWGPQIRKFSKHAVNKY